MGSNIPTKNLRYSPKRCLTDPGELAKPRICQLNLERQEFRGGGRPLKFKAPYVFGNVAVADEEPPDERSEQVQVLVIEQEIGNFLVLREMTAPFAECSRKNARRESHNGGRLPGLDLGRIS